MRSCTNETYLWHTEIGVLGATDDDRTAGRMEHRGALDREMALDICVYLREYAGVVQLQCAPDLQHGHHRFLEDGS